MKLFHKTFLNILDNKDPLNKFDYIEKSDLSIQKSITSPDDIIYLAPFFISGVKRQQTLIKTSKDYYVARDNLTNTVYICFKNLLTIDIDDENIQLETIQDKLYLIPETFRIYKSKRGYHIYCTSKSFDYRSKQSVELMFNNFCDPYYCVYSYIRGYCTRLNNKFNSACLQIYKYIGKIGTSDENERLVYLVNLMEKYSNKYKNEINLNNDKTNEDKTNEDKMNEYKTNEDKTNIN